MTSARQDLASLRRLKGVSSDKVAPVEVRRRSWGEVPVQTSNEQLARDQISDVKNSNTPNGNNKSDISNDNRFTTHNVAAVLSREKEREKDFMSLVNAKRGAKRLFRARSVGSVRESALAGRSLPPLFEFEATDNRRRSLNLHNTTGDYRLHDRFSTSVHRPVAFDTRYPAKLSPRSHSRRDSKPGFNRMTEPDSDIQTRVDARWMAYKRSQERRTSRVNSMQFMNALRDISQTNSSSHPTIQRHRQFPDHSSELGGSDTVCFFCHQTIVRPTPRSPRTDPSVSSKSASSNGPNTPHQHSPRNNRTQLQAGHAAKSSPRPRDIYQPRTGLLLSNFVGLPITSSPHIRKNSRGTVHDFASVPELELHGLIKSGESEHLQLSSLSPGMSDSALMRAFSAIDSAIAINSPIQPGTPNMTYSSNNQNMKRSMSHKGTDNGSPGSQKTTLMRSLTDTQKKPTYSPGGTMRNSQFVNKMVENIEKGQVTATPSFLPENSEIFNRELLSGANSDFARANNLPTRYDWSPTSVRRLCNDLGMSADNHSQSPKRSVFGSLMSPIGRNSRSANDEAVLEKQLNTAESESARSGTGVSKESAGGNNSGPYLQQYLEDLEDREEVINGTFSVNRSRRNSGGQGVVHSPPLPHAYINSHAYPSRVQTQPQLQLQPQRAYSTPNTRSGTDRDKALFEATRSIISENSDGPEGICDSAGVPDPLANIDEVPSRDARMLGDDEGRRPPALGVSVSNNATLGMSTMSAASSPPKMDLLSRSMSWPGVQTIAESSETPLSPHDEEESESEHDHVIAPSLVFGTLEAPGPASSNWKPISEKHTFLNGGLTGANAAGRTNASGAASVGAIGKTVGRRRPSSPGGLCDVVLTESEGEFSMKPETEANASYPVHEYGMDMCLTTEGIMGDASPGLKQAISGASHGPIHHKHARLEMSSIDEASESIIA